MKKNLQLALAIMLGLATTTVTAQDWSVDSETRVTNMSDDNNEVNGDTEQFMRMGVSWGNDNVSVHASFNGYADLNYGTDFAQDAATFGLHEAYASTDVMGFASLSAGRMALEYGSGRVIGSNDWENQGGTFDGFTVGINNDFADITLGMARWDMDMNDVESSVNGMFLNAGKEMGDMAFDFTYYTADASDGTIDGETTVMALEGSYDLAMGATLMFGYYSASDALTGFEDFDQGMTTIGASYEVMDGLSLHGAYEMYDENGFHVTTGNQLGYGNGTGAFIIDMEGTQMVFGADYDMGDFGFGVSMYNFESEEMNGVTVESEAMDFSASYAFNENASLGLKYSTTTLGWDDNGVLAESADMPDMMWMSLNVSF